MAVDKGARRVGVGNFGSRSNNPGVSFWMSDPPRCGVHLRRTGRALARTTPPAHPGKSEPPEESRVDGPLAIGQKKSRPEGRLFQQYRKSVSVSWLRG